MYQICRFLGHITETCTKEARFWYISGGILGLQPIPVLQPYPAYMRDGGKVAQLDFAAVGAEDASV